MEFRFLHCQQKALVPIGAHVSEVEQQEKVLQRNEPTSLTLCRNLMVVLYGVVWHDSVKYSFAVCRREPQS
jgi:hypothetical protein